MKNRILAGLLSLAVAVGFAACGTQPAGSSEADIQSSSAPAQSTETQSSAPQDGGESPQATGAAELVTDMKLGWNLGNTLDAQDESGSLGVGSETAWGNPKTTKAMIDAVKQAGFNVVRVPVTWQGHIGKGPDYTVDEAWMARVAEVVGYVLDNDMYCILNTHHEDWVKPTQSDEAQVEQQLRALWAQIAGYFKDYSEKLLFEGLNEPRLQGTADEWTAGTGEARDVVNSLNMAFVDTVRGSGGGNDTRALLLPAYVDSYQPEALEALALPEDDSNIIVTVHAYIPYEMALDKNSGGSFIPTNPGDTADIANMILSLEELFTSKGIPVIIGEMGALDKDNLASRVLWADFYVGYAALYGIPCIVWDNGILNGEGDRFGLLDREKLTWAYPDIVEAMVAAAGAGEPLHSDVSDPNELDLQQ